MNADRWQYKCSQMQTKKATNTKTCECWQMPITNAHIHKQGKTSYKIVIHIGIPFLWMLTNANKESNKHTQGVTCKCWQMPITNAHVHKQIKATHTQPTKATIITYQDLPSQSCESWLKKSHPLAQILNILSSVYVPLLNFSLILWMERSLIV